MLLRNMFSRSWIIATLLVVGGSALCIRLGVWQLDRLEQRRAFNAQVQSMRAAEVLDLNQNAPSDVASMSWRAIQVVGEYDFENQVALRNQARGAEYGFHLITPLRFNNGAILVDRGFIPADGNASPADWRKYDERGAVEIRGQLRLSDAPLFGGGTDASLMAGETRIEFWNIISVEGIASQLPYPILPVFIQPDVDENDAAFPIPYQPEVDLTEGSHFGYALQWFSFAAILFFGYPFYLRKHLAENAE
ncbi:MAG: SURF1 family protein [Anaerolineales bacterium]|nr:SURF1 family protein [Anaerolineales bacterium]